MLKALFVTSAVGFLVVGAQCFVLAWKELSYGLAKSCGMKLLQEGLSQ
jgi:hypothetical protein